MIMNDLTNTNPIRTLLNFESKFVDEMILYLFITNIQWLIGKMYRDL